MLVWAWRRIVEIITQHDWQLLALFISILGALHGAAILITHHPAWPEWWPAIGGAGGVLLAAALFVAVLFVHARAARYTLFALSCVLGWQAWFLFAAGPEPHIAGFLVAGGASFGAGLAFLAAGE